MHTNKKLKGPSYNLKCGLKYDYSEACHLKTIKQGLLVYYNQISLKSEIGRYFLQKSS